MKEILGFIALGIIIFLAIVIPTASYLSTISQGNDVVSIASDGDINDATDRWADMTVDVVYGETIGTILAPLITCIVGILTPIVVWALKQ